MQGFFSRLYKFRETDQRNQKENFLTEIFAQVLRTDSNVRDSFLEFINYDSERLNFSCVTQFTDDTFGRPDIFITMGQDSEIIVECKVDATQESTQLKRYHSLLLKRNKRNRYLIYLTKYLEETEDYPGVRFKKIRWHDIYDMIDSSQNEISKELSIFLKEENMSNKILFTNSDLNTVKSFIETYSKIKEFLFLSKDVLNKYSKSKIQYEEYNKEGYYGYTTDLASGILWIGFYQFPHNSELQLGLEISQPPSETQTFQEIEKQLEFLKWEKYHNEYSNKTCWYNSKGISTFFNGEAFETKMALNFLETNIIEVKEWLV